MMCVFANIVKVLYLRQNYPNKIYNAMTQTFDITPDRNFLQHFLTGWRVKSLSPEMVDLMPPMVMADGCPW